MPRIALTNGGFAEVDPDDVAVVSPYRWHRNSSGYARSSVWRDGKTNTVYMHRLLLGFPPRGVDIDHFDGDRLNNRRANLRRCSRSENAANQLAVRGASRFRGVSFHKRSRRWHAEMKLEGRRMFIGSFATEREAADAYDAFALEHRGRFARLNTPAID